MKIVYDEKTGNPVLDMTDEQGKVAGVGQDRDAAEMEQGGLAATLNKFSGMQVAGVPVGGVVLGTAGAFVLDKVIVDRILAKETDPEKAASTAMLWDLLLALAIGKWGGKYIGKETAKSAAFVLTYEAISGKVATWLDGVWPKSSAEASQSQPMRAAYEVPQVFEQPAMQPMMQPSGMQNTGGGLGAYAGAF